MTASYGHRVLGVDLSPTGIGQMEAKAAAHGLDVVGKVADICSFESSEIYDAVILDRVVHMLVSIEDKIQLPHTAASSTQGRRAIIDRYTGKSANGR